ncbi:MAG TPA: MATE family efflux transporter [Bacillota bacterium]|nr:MATE family efflux transporter [Bacillota bacterium]
MNQSKDMTKGNIWKCLLLFALPIFIGNLFQQFYNIADLMVIGKIVGEKGYSAIGAASPFSHLFIGFANGFTSGFSVVLARAFGAKDQDGMKKAINLSYWMTFAMSLLLTCVSLLLLHPILLALDTPTEIIGMTENYLKITLSLGIFTMFYNMLAGLLRAIGNSRAPLYFLIASTLINVILDVLFVKYCHLGVNGAAYATVLSQLFSVIMCTLYCAKKCKSLLFDRKLPTKDKAMVFEMASTGLSMGFMLAVVYVGTVVLQKAVNGFGVMTVAAHTAARRVDDLFMLVLGTMSLSAATFVGQNFGAGKLERVKKGIRNSILMSFAWSGFALTVVLLFHRQIIHLLTSSENEVVYTLAGRYVRINIAFFFVLSILLILRSSLQAIGHKIVPVCGSILELVLKVGCVILITPIFKYNAVIWLEPAIWVLCAIIVIVDYAVFLKKQRLVLNTEKNTR